MPSGINPEDPLGPAMHTQVEADVQYALQQRVLQGGASSDDFHSFIASTLVLPPLRVSEVQRTRAARSRHELGQGTGSEGAGTSTGSL